MNIANKKTIKSISLGSFLFGSFTATISSIQASEWTAVCWCGHPTLHSCSSNGGERCTCNTCTLHRKKRSEMRRKRQNTQWISRIKDTISDRNSFSDIIKRNVIRELQQDSPLHGRTRSNVLSMEFDKMKQQLSIERIRTSLEKGAKTKVHMLCIAAMRRESDVVKLLLEHGVDVNEKDENSWTPLHWAATLKNEAIVNILIAANSIDVNLKDKNSQTPLHLAAESGNINIVNILLEHQADINATDNNGQTSLHLAAKSGNEAIVKVLVTVNGIDVNATDNNSQTHLHLAVEANNETIIKILLEHGADANVKNSNGQTPLDIAKNETVKEILQKAMQQNE